MSPARWKQVEALYHSALDRGPAERQAFLTEACTDDPELRREVESLLAQPTGDGLLNRPAGELLDATVTLLPVGARLGPYRIVEKLGEGGMGEVYSAHDSDWTASVSGREHAGDYA